MYPNDALVGASGAPELRFGACQDMYWWWPVILPNDAFAVGKDFTKLIRCGCKWQSEMGLWFWMELFPNGALPTPSNDQTLFNDGE